MIQSRRLFLWGAGAALITAPAIVRASSLMQVKQMADSWCTAYQLHYGDGVALTSMLHPSLNEALFASMCETVARIRDENIISIELCLDKWKHSGLRIGNVRYL